MNGSGEENSPEDSLDLRTEASRSAGDELIPEGLSFRNDVLVGGISDVFNGAPLGAGATNNSINPSGSLLGVTNDALVQRELLSRAFALNGHSGSSPIGSFQVQQNDIARAAAGLPNVNPPMNELESRIQLLKSQLDLQPSLPQQPMMGSLDFRHIRPANPLLLSMQHQLQMDQQRLQEQQQKQFQSNPGVLGSFLPGAGSLSSPTASTLAMVSQLGSQINPSQLIQDPLLPNPSSLAAFLPGAMHQNLPYAAAPIQGLDLLQPSRTKQEFSGGARKSTFPMKLQRILADPRFHDCISWLPNGKSWRVLNQYVFVNAALPEFFKHQKYASFMRQVNGWGFKRKIEGPDINSYSHELFVRDNPELCLKMRRLKQGSQGAAEDSQGGENDS